MCKVEEELQTPPEILKTVKTLAPKGSPLEQTAAAMRLAIDLYLYQAKVKPPKVDKNPLLIFSI